MQTVKGKDLMVPLAEYVTFSGDARRYDAVMALKEAQKQVEEERERHWPILISLGWKPSLNSKAGGAKVTVLYNVTFDPCDKGYHGQTYASGGPDRKPQKSEILRGSRISVSPRGNRGRACSSVCLCGFTPNP